MQKPLKIAILVSLFVYITSTFGNSVKIDSASSEQNAPYPPNEMEANMGVLLRALSAKFSIDAEAKIQKLLFGNAGCIYSSNGSATNYIKKHKQKQKVLSKKGPYSQGLSYPPHRLVDLPLDDSEISNILVREIFRSHTSMRIKQQAIFSLGCSNSELSRSLINALYNNALLVALITVDRQEILTSDKINNLIQQDPDAAKQRLARDPDILSHIGQARYTPDYSNMKERENKIKNYTSYIKRAALNATYRRDDKMKFESIYMDAWNDKNGSNFYLAKDLLDKSGLSSRRGLHLDLPPETLSSRRLGFWIRKVKKEVPVGMTMTELTHWVTQHGIETHTFRADQRDLVILLERVASDEHSACKQWPISVRVMLDENLKQVESHNLGISANCD